MLPVIVGGLLLLAAVAVQSRREGFQTTTTTSSAPTDANLLDSNANLQKTALQGAAGRVKAMKDKIVSKGGDSVILSGLADTDKTSYQYAKSVIDSFYQSVDTSTFINQAKLDDLIKKFGAISNLLSLVNTSLATLERLVNAPSDELGALKRIITEIQSMYQSIKSNKEKQQPYLYTKVFVNPPYLPNSAPSPNSIPDYNTIYKVETLFADVAYIGQPATAFQQNDMAEINDFDSLSADRKQVVRKQIYGIYQQTQLLYYLFVGLPGMIYGSNTVVDSDATPAPNLEDTEILDRVKQAYMNSLNSIPDFTSRLQDANTALANAAGNVTATMTADQMMAVQTAFYTWQRLVNIELNARKFVIVQANAVVNATPAGATRDAPTKILESLRNTKRDAITSYQAITNTTAPAGLYMKLNAVPAAGPAGAAAGSRKSRTAFQQDIQTFDTALSTAAKAVATEGFQSGGNPYNSMPASKQALEFRLGQQRLINQVGGVAW